MPKKLNLKPGFFYTLGEEIANAITHGVGSALAVAGTVILIVNAVGDPWKVVSASIYGFSMILLFTMSCLYHAITNQRAKRIIRVFDHTSIFVLIAGTYTPFTLVTLRGWVGWTIFGIVWGAAVFGIVLNIISIARFKTVSMVCYIASGWCVVIAFVPLLQKLALPGMLLLILGGLVYTGGILFYRRKGVRAMHALWHGFVLAGALLHYFDILFYVIRA